MNRVSYLFVNGLLLFFAFIIVGGLIWALVSVGTFKDIESFDSNNVDDGNINIPNTDLECVEPIFINGFYYCNIDNITKQR